MLRNLLLLEVAILGANLQERGLWERECTALYFLVFSFDH